MLWAILTFLGGKDVHSSGEDEEAKSDKESDNIDVCDQIENKNAESDAGLNHAADGGEMDDNNIAAGEADNGSVDSAVNTLAGNNEVWDFNAKLKPALLLKTVFYYQCALKQEQKVQYTKDTALSAFKDAVTLYNTIAWIFPRDCNDIKRYKSLEKEGGYFKVLHY